MPIPCTHHLDQLPRFLVCEVGRYPKADPYHHSDIKREGAEAAVPITPYILLDAEGTWKGMAYQAEH